MTEPSAAQEAIARQRMGEQLCITVEQIAELHWNQGTDEFFRGEEKVSGNCFAK